MAISFMLLNVKAKFSNGCGVKSFNLFASLEKYLVHCSVCSYRFFKLSLIKNV